MLQKLLYKITGQEKKDRQALNTLEAFLAQTMENQLTDREAQQHLEKGVVELVQYDCHIANGLLITDNGYFLTAGHCLDDDDDDDDGWKLVRLYDGTEYALERICASGTGRMDIALAKAKVPGDASPRSYRFYKEDYIPAKEPIALLTRKNGQLVKKYGHTTNYTTAEGKTLVSTLGVKPGDSGGIVITGESELLGIMRRGLFKKVVLDKLQDEYPPAAFAYSVPSKAALAFVRWYIELLKGKLQ